MEYFKPYLDNSNDFEQGVFNVNHDNFLVNNNSVKNNRAIHNDKVFIKDAEVVGIKERSQQIIIGILHLNNNQKYGFNKRNVPYYKFTSISGKFPQFIVPTKSKEKKAMYCAIKFNKWNTNNKHPIGQIETLIGQVGIFENEIDMLFYHTNIYPKKNKTKYLNNNQLTQSIDYNTFSIDPKGCKDIDDALHFKKYDDYIEIGIHIANVARIIKTLDTNFFSTIYLDNKQINMLDDEITYNVCSLGDGLPKQALSLILKYNKEELIEYYFKETIVVNKALSYEEANRIIENSNSHDLKDLNDFTRTLKKLPNLDANKMIEHYMLLYNHLFAKKCYNYDKHTILRTHQLKFQNCVLNDEKLQLYLNRLNQNAANYIVNPENTCHEQLQLDYYTHATSPIRRYVDIINQINMINLIKNESFIATDNIESINLFQKKSRKFYNYYKKLKLIFNMKEPLIKDAYIIDINNLKIKVYIPDIDIEHGFLILSNKLLNSNEILSDSDKLTLNNITLKLYSKIKIKITPLQYEEKFNKKLNIKIVEPQIKIY